MVGRVGGAGFGFEVGSSVVGLLVVAVMDEFGGREFPTELSFDGAAVGSVGLAIPHVPSPVSKMR